MSNNESKYKFCPKKERIAITCGDAAENHTGMEMLGNVGEKGSGFTISDLKQIKKRLEKNGIQCDYIDLRNDEAVEMQKKGYKSIKTNKKKEAGVLILRNYISENKIEKIYNELSNIEWDKKYYDTRRKTVLNKHARENLIFLKGRNQEPDYENKKGRIVDLNNLENLNSMMDKLFNTINKETGGKAKNLIGEGNRYYTIKDGKKVKNGIGWHGDAERRKVICFCIGGINYCMKWQWFYKNKPVKHLLIKYY